MCPMNDEPSIVGEWPSLRGGEIQELIAQEFWCDGKLEDEANVLYLKVSNEWHRLYFDYEIVFWQKGPNGIDDPSADRGKEFGYPLRDLKEELGLNDQTIVECTRELLSNGVAVLFQFSNGKHIQVSSVDDQTKIKT